MRLHLDDDSADPNLVRLLLRDGHDVQIPADVGLTGRSDQAHLALGPWPLARRVQSPWHQGFPQETRPFRSRTG